MGIERAPMDTAALLFEVWRTIRPAGIKPTRFGIDAVRDPRLFFDMQRGRELRPVTEGRVREHLARCAS